MLFVKTMGKPYMNFGFLWNFDFVKIPVQNPDSLRRVGPKVDFWAKSRQNGDFCRHFDENVS